jgi:hypothetical protein
MVPLFGPSRVDVPVTFIADHQGHAMAGCRQLDPALLRRSLTEEIGRRRTWWSTVAIPRVCDLPGLSRRSERPAQRLAQESHERGACGAGPGEQGNEIPSGCSPLVEHGYGEVVLPLEVLNQRVVGGRIRRGLASAYRPTVGTWR